MKKLLLQFILLLLCTFIYAQAPDWLWTVQVGGPLNDDRSSVATDNQGNIYIAGYFQGTVIFGSTVLTSSGLGDIYVAKMDANCNWLWARKAGGLEDDRVFGIAVDNSSNVYVTGRFIGTATFATTPVTSYGYDDIFVAKLNANGFLVWVKQAGGPEFDGGLDIALDNSANVFITGYFYNTAVFGTLSITSSGVNDIFVSKLDTNGNWLWARKAGGIGGDTGYGVAVDNSGNVYCTGHFVGTAVFALQTITSFGGDDIFVAKLDANGFLIWVKQAGSPLQDEAFSISVDNSANAYVTGYFNGTALFLGTGSVTSYGDTDIFVAKIDSLSNWQWARGAGGIGSDEGIAVTTDNAGSCYVTGYFPDTATFALSTLTSFGQIDIFLAKLDTNGFISWLKQAGGVGLDHGSSVFVDSLGNLYLAGYFENDAVFGPFNLTSLGLYDAFISKFESTVPVDDDDAPGIFTLSQLYDAWPNPFHPGQAVSIKTDIAQQETGKLTIFNLLGQRITEYDLNSDTNQISFDSKGLASGIYLYQLRTQSVNQVKKMVLVK